MTAAFIQHFEGPVNDLLAPIDHTLADTQIGVAYGITTLPHLKDLNIVGPQRVTGVSETASRRKIFVCRPTSPGEETACASQIVRRLGGQAFRRPLTDADFKGLMRFYEEGPIRAQLRIRRRVRDRSDAGEPAVRVPPRTRRSTPALAARFSRAASAGIGDVELASRLSFFLWGSVAGSGTDGAGDRRTSERRWDDVAAGRAHDVTPKQVKRMLGDPQAEALSTRFAAQWLRLNDVDGMLPDAVLYPYYDHTLGEALVRETELFFDSIVREDRSVLDLLIADYSFVNERVARHYGIPNVTGNQFRRVQAARIPPRSARPGQHPRPDVGGRPHVAGDARQVDDGSAARVAASAAAAERPGTRGHERYGERQGADRPRADGGASQESGVRVVPPRHRSDGPGARELRRHGPLAHQGQRVSGRCRRRDVRRHEARGTRPDCARAAEASGRVPADVHGKPDDLRARTPDGIHGHAGDPEDRARRRQKRTTGYPRS